MTSASTLLEVLRDFSADGFDGSFWAVEGGVRCGRCRTTTPAAEVGFTALHRLEGASDPDDMSAVVALVCPSCGLHGTAVLHYGPTASAEESDVLAALADRRPADEAAVDPDDTAPPP